MLHMLSALLYGEGFLTGVMLTMMLGPVTMIILRYGLQVNRVAGVYAASGTWFSDFVFIGFTYWMTSSIEAWSQQPDIRMSLYLAGGFGLLVMGALLLKARQKTFSQNMEGVKANYAQAFISGFLVNSLSPFTLFFWLGAAVFVHIQPHSPIWYYAGVMMALAMGDFAKAWLAPKLTLFLKDHHVYWIQVVAGVLIASTGVYIMAMGFLEN